MPENFDALETREPAAREAAHFETLGRQIAHAKAGTAHFAAHLSEFKPEDVRDRAGLARLPVTRKSALIELQSENPPFGGLAARAPGDFPRLFFSPGPIADPDGGGRDWWRLARALFAAGFRRGDIMHNCFSYHFTPAGAMLESGAHALGCAVFPGGTGQTEGQVQAMLHFRPNGFAGTPDFLKIVLDKAAEMKADLRSLQKALVSGGALLPSLRQEIAARGVAVRQCYATADLGLVAYESEAMEGMIVDEGVILEIVRPGTGDPVPPGEVGEVLVTTLNPDYPLIRFATGDLSALLPGRSACGRTNMRIKGWMGRADQTTKIRGMFVHPEQVARVLRRHREIVRARLVVHAEQGRDLVALKCETAAPSAALANAIAESVQAECKIKAEIELLPSGTLPNDGKVIEDARSYR
jgi:phenylacetate-CoA ligase